MRAAVQRSIGVMPTGSPRRLHVRHEDLRKKVRVRPPRSLVVFVVDASDSMGTDARMAAAKGAVLGLLLSAYRRRDRVAVVVFGGDQASVLLSPTGSTGLARERLRRLPVGGATPLADGLLRAWQLIATERRRQPGMDARIVLLSDGQANVALRGTRDVFGEIVVLARRIAKDGVRSVVLDTTRQSSGELDRIARALGTQVRRVGRLGAGVVAAALREQPPWTSGRD